MTTDAGKARSVAVLLEQLLAPVPGGTGRYSAEVARWLAATEPQRDVIGFTAAHRDRAAATIPGVRGPRVLPLPRRALIAAWDRGLGPAPRGVDLIHAPTLLMPPKRRTPLVVTIHDAVPWTHPQTLTERGVAWHRRTAQRAARDADAIVVPTNAVRDELSTYLDIEHKVTVVGLGVSQELALPEDAAQRAESMGLPERYLLSVATFEPRKGLDTLIEALADERAPKIPLVVVGQPGWGGIDLADEARRCGVPPEQVIVLGRLSDADLAVAFHRAAALVAPSRSEGFGIPVLEAMAAGTPVIHSDIRALLEVAGGAGISTPVDQPRPLAEAISALLADPHEQARLRRAGLDRATHYSWQRCAERLWQLYDDVLGRLGAR